MFNDLAFYFYQLFSFHVQILTNKSAKREFPLEMIPESVSFQKQLYFKKYKLITRRLIALYKPSIQLNSCYLPCDQLFHKVLCKSNQSKTTVYKQTEPLMYRQHCLNIIRLQVSQYRSFFLLSSGYMWSFSEKQRKQAA